MPTGRGPRPRADGLGADTTDEPRSSPVRPRFSQVKSEKLFTCDTARPQARPQLLPGSASPTAGPARLSRRTQQHLRHIYVICIYIDL